MRRVFLGGVGIFILDQGTKYVMLSFLQQGFFQNPILSFFNLVERWNRGISFGLLGNQAFPPWSLSLVSAGVCCGLVIWSFKEHDFLNRLATALILGGALSNAYDRLTYGAVFDFLEFHLGSYYWPAFNGADSAIVLGVSLLFLKGLIKTKEESNPRSGKEE